jgi:hypothetical protein
VKKNKDYTKEKEEIEYKETKEDKKDQKPVTGPYCELDESNPHPISLRFILILSSYLHLELPSGPFPSGFPTMYVFITSPCYMPHPSHPPCFDHPNIR